MDTDGQNLKVVEKIEGFNAVWSHDGKRLLFSQVGEDSSLCAADADGANVRVLVRRGKGTLILGAWSPDGKRLAYTSLADAKQTGLFIAQADGSQPKRLLGGTDEIAFVVRWSADGKRLFFTRRNRSGPPLEKNEKNPAGGRDWGPAAVHVMDLETQKIRRFSPANEREYVGGNIFAMRTLMRQRKLVRNGDKKERKIGERGRSCSVENIESLGSFGVSHWV